MKEQTWRQWLRVAMKDPNSPIELPRGLTLAALTGQDARALEAIAQCWKLYAASDLDGERGALEAIRALLPAMQPSTRPFARELIPWALDWHDRHKLWALVQPAPGERAPVRLIATGGGSFVAERGGGFTSTQGGGAGQGQALPIGGGGGAAETRVTSSTTAEGWQGGSSSGGTEHASRREPDE